MSVMLVGSVSLLSCHAFLLVDGLKGMSVCVDNFFFTSVILFVFNLAIGKYP